MIVAGAGASSARGKSDREGRQIAPLRTSRKSLQESEYKGNNKQTVEEMSEEHHRSFHRFRYVIVYVQICSVQMRCTLETLYASVPLLCAIAFVHVNSMPTRKIMIVS